MSGNEGETAKEWLDRVEYVLVDKGRLAYMKPADFDRLIAMARDSIEISKDPYEVEFKALRAKINRYEVVVKRARDYRNSVPNSLYELAVKALEGSK